MADSGLRNLGTLVPGARGDAQERAALDARSPQRDGRPAEAPQPDPGGPGRPASAAAALTSGAPASPAQAAAPASAARPAAPVFAADAADDPATLASSAPGLDAPLELLAGLALHARTQTPLAIGLLGPPGCGKSVALARLADAIERLGAAAGSVAASPYVAPVAVLRVDAADLDGRPAAALAEALHGRLAALAPALAVEASCAARDPAAAAHEAFERLDAARRRLDVERRALDEADARRARLADALLYETPGSQIDAYAAGRRSRLKATMARFGIAGDPLLGYKDMVAEAADSRGGASRTGFALRAFWGLKGQARLIVTALILAAVGLGLGAAFEHQSKWLSLLGAEQQTAGAAAWIAAHADWLLTLRSAAFAGAALALLLNLWRGARLLQLVFRGESLLRGELAARRRDSDGHFGHQARRVETLAAEVERLSRQAAEAERRAGASIGAPAEPSPFATDALGQEARRFIAAVGALAQKRGAGAAPGRIIVALDNLDALPAARAHEVLAAAHGLIGPGFVSLIALDPARLGAEAAQSLAKWIGAPLQIGEIAARRDLSAQVRDLLGAASPAATPARAPDASRSALDEPLREAEAALLAALAPLAGPSPRAVKRFVNLYRLLRAQAPEPSERGALALLLALDAGGRAADIAAANRAFLGAGGDFGFEAQQIGPRLASALAALGGRPDNDALRRAAALARMFSFRQSGEEAMPI